MEKPLVIIARNIPKQGLEELYKHCTVKMHRSAKPPSRKQLLSYARAAHALVTVLTEKDDAELFAAGKNLKIVANYAVGYDNIDVKAARKAGVYLRVLKNTLARRAVQGTPFEAVKSYDAEGE